MAMSLGGQGCRELRVSSVGCWVLWVKALAQLELARLDMPSLRFPGWALDWHSWLQPFQTHPPNWDITVHSQIWTRFPGGSFQAFFQARSRGDPSPAVTVTLGAGALEERSSGQLDNTGDTQPHAPKWWGALGPFQDPGSAKGRRGAGAGAGTVPIPMVAWSHTLGCAWLLFMQATILLGVTTRHRVRGDGCTGSKRPSNRVQPRHRAGACEAACRQPPAPQHIFATCRGPEGPRGKVSVGTGHGDGLEPGG